MIQNNPRVSIGLAVFNGSRYLRQAIDSILAQTFADFELIISDNASTDETEEICRRYVAKDQRIRYYRNSTNIGGANNENRTFLLSRGEFFRWAAHDDMIAPNLLSKCVAVLDQDPSVILCYPMVTEINEDGEFIRTISQNRGSSIKPHERFRDLAQEDHNCEATYGLVRADILRKTRLQKNYTGSDRTLLCELSLYGQFYEIPEPLFYKRYHSQNIYVNMRARMAWFNPALKGKIVFPFWMQLIDYLTVINRAPLPLSEKIRCYAMMIYWIRDHGKNLAGDILLAFYALLHHSRDPYAWRNKNKDIYNWGK
jgi:glycosyltransferase involved in cell wall biosynthesis